MALRKRSRGEDDSSEVAPIESPLTQLNAGQDPIIHKAGNVYTLRRADPSELDGVGHDDGEKRAYLLRDPEAISMCFDKWATRDRKNNLLLNWSMLRQLPPAWYSIVFPLTTEPTGDLLPGGCQELQVPCRPRRARSRR